MMKKKLIAVLAIAVMLVSVLVACQRHEKPDESADLRLLEFPGTHWNDTPETVIAALDISEEQILENQAVPNEADTVSETWSLVVSGLKCLDAATDQTAFTFVRYNGEGDYGLAYVKVTLPEDADLQSMAAAVTDHYGVASTDTLPRYDLTDGGVEDITHRDWGSLSVDEAGEHTYWLAGVTGTSYLSEEQQQKVIDVYTRSEITSASPETITQFMELEPLSYILLSDCGNALARSSGEDVSPNVLVFSGQQLLFLTRYFS